MSQPKGSRKRKLETTSSAAVDDSSSLPSTSAASAVSDLAEALGHGRKIIVVLDKAALETTKTKRNDFELLNCDDHRHIAKKNGLDPAQYRPDILHQVRRNSAQNSPLPSHHQGVFLITARQAHTHTHMSPGT